MDAGGLTLTSGTGNVLLGSTADTAAAGTSNGVALGYQAVCADNEFALGPNLTSMNLQGAVWPRRHPGRARLTANATNGTTSFSSLSDLSLTLVAGRNYCGRLALRCSDSTAAEGLKVDFNGGTATMTAFNAGLTGNVQGATAGTTVSAALAAALNLTAMNGTGDHWLVFDVSLTVNAGGTFTPRFAQNSHSTGTATAAAGSYLWLEDSPN